MGIIRERFFMSSNYKPKDLPVREDLVKELVQKLKQGNCRILLAGLTGTGKTLSTENAIERLNKGVEKFLLVYINCAECKTYTAVSKRIIEVVTGKSYDERGLSKSQIAEDLKKVLSRKKTNLIFVFDEIDKIVLNKGDHQEVLFPLLNYSKNASFVLISNDTNILSKLDPRIQSRLSAEIRNVSVYQPEEIRKILKQRIDLALVEGCCSDDVLDTLAQFSSDISGDIRFALKLLEQSASYVESNNLSAIYKEVVQDVIDELENSEFDRKFISLNKHQKMCLFAISLECKKKPEHYAVTYPDSYNTYAKLARKHRMVVMGDRRFRDYLSELQMLDLVSLQNKSTNKRGGRLRIAVPNFDFHKLLDNYESKKEAQSE